MDFDASRMQKVKETYEAWWNHELDRPIISVAQKVREPENPGIPLLSQANCHDFSVSPEEIIERYDQELSCYEFLGDAYPKMNMDCFGPGVVSAFCGATLDNSSGAVWFFPPKDKKPIEEMHIVYDPQNPWAVRCKEIYRAAVKRWKGAVVPGFPDFGGSMDILANFRTSQQLLYDLYDDPDEVIRLVGEIHVAWREAMEDMARAMEVDRYGCTDWNGFYSREKAYILQCDFSYMIGNDMFRQFALGEIRKTAEYVKRCNYHLDGRGALAHLDDLLTIDRIRMIQWVPGDGNPLGVYWMDVYRRILSAGKGAQIIAGFAQFEEVAAQLGTAKDLFFGGGDPGITGEMLRKYGVES